MTLADIENLLEEKDNLIASAAVELKAFKEENELNFLKIKDLNKRNVELTAELADEKRINNKDQLYKEIDKLKLVITEKSQLIEDERKRIEDLRKEFNKRLDERNLLEDELLKNSVHVPDRLIENQEKTSLYQKIQNLRLQNTKMKAEIEKHKKAVEDMKAKMNEQDRKRQAVQDENKNLLNAISNDTKSLALVKKERDELKEKVKSLQAELAMKIELINKANQDQNLAPKEQQAKIDDTQQVNPENRRGNSKGRMQFTKKNPDPFQLDKNVIENKVKESEKRVKISTSMKQIPSSPSKESAKDFKVDETPEVVLKRLTYFCVKKNINMQRHLMRYDITKLGKINQSDFSKAIDELKLGFIDPDINKLLEISKSEDNFVEIRNFINMMVKVDTMYEHTLKEFGKS